MSYRVEFNFDLSIEKLKQNYPGKNWQKAWSDVKKFLEANGFKHNLFSGYISVEPMTEAKATRLMYKLDKTMPWVFKSASGWNMTRAYGDAVDVLNTICGDSLKEIVKDKEFKTEKVSAKEEAEEKTSIRSQIADAEKKLERKEQNKGKVKDFGLEL